MSRYGVALSARNPARAHWFESKHYDRNAQDE